MAGSRKSRCPPARTASSTSLTTRSQHDPEELADRAHRLRCVSKRLAVCHRVTRPGQASARRGGEIAEDGAAVCLANLETVLDRLNAEAQRTEQELMANKTSTTPTGDAPLPRIEGRTQVIRGLHHALAPLAWLLPGTGVWARVMDLNGTAFGQMPTVMVVAIALLTMAGECLALAQRISARLRSDAATERDKLIRERMHKRNNQALDQTNEGPQLRPFVFLGQCKPLSVNNPESLCEVGYQSFCLSQRELLTLLPEELERHSVRSVQSVGNERHHF